MAGEEVCTTSAFRQYPWNSASSTPKSDMARQISEIRSKSGPTPLGRTTTPWSRLKDKASSSV